MSATNHRAFAALAADAARCTRCAAMCDRSAVLSERNGSISARIMFIGEAPGRKGADQTRVPFSGDQSGKNFDRFLASIGLNRRDIFITSAALCNPRAESGANRKPSQIELKNCSEFLRRTFAIVDPVVVVTLGSVALSAIKTIMEHGLTLKDAAKEHQWNGRTLVPIYHPSPQVLASHRREAEQLSDYKVVARAIKRFKAATNDSGFASLCAERLGLSERSLTSNSEATPHFAGAQPLTSSRMTRKGKALPHIRRQSRNRT